MHVETKPSAALSEVRIPPQQHVFANFEKQGALAN